jgi:RNA polymerase sigma-70 factor (sigma-E family)
MTGDSAWVDHVAVGEAAPEFEDFVRTETGSLLRTAFLLTGTAAAAEDLVQETLTRLYPKWAKVRAARYPYAYVRRSLINMHLNSLRSRSSGEIVSNELVAGAATSDAADLVADHEWIVTLLDRLPQRQRAALVLSYLDDLSAEEVARALGCRAGTARSLVSRGLSTLRELTKGAEHV